MERLAGNEQNKWRANSCVKDIDRIDDIRYVPINVTLQLFSSIVTDSQLNDTACHCGGGVTSFMVSVSLLICFTQKETYSSE